MSVPLYVRAITYFVVFVKTVVPANTKSMRVPSAGVVGTSTAFMLTDSNAAPVGILLVPNVPE